MQFYLLLQLRTILRRMSDFGIHPALGVPLATAAFWLVTDTLFARTSLAPYLLAASVLGPLSKLSDRDRVDFLKTCFSNQDLRLIRLTENLAVATPFAVVFLYHGHWPWAIGLTTTASLLSLARINRPTNFALPTPFGRHPFEYAVGFRRTWWLIALAYVFLYLAITVPNYNLGVVSILMIALVTMSYQLQPEPPYFAWIFAHSPGKFLAYKIRVALISTALLMLPPSVILIAAYPISLGIIGVVYLVTLTYLATVILAKYADFPQKIGVGKATILGFTLWMVPILFGVIPTFYRQAKEKLAHYLK